jgi:hypothetical protein
MAHFRHFRRRLRRAVMAFANPCQLDDRAALDPDPWIRAVHGLRLTTALVIAPTMIDFLGFAMFAIGIAIHGF